MHVVVKIIAALTAMWLVLRMVASVKSAFARKLFFQFTRGRFLADNRAKLDERYQRFDAKALGKAAAKAMGAASCARIEKHHEGVYNKIFLLTMDNGIEVIAKIPQPNAGFTRRVIASEVATMDFARNVLETPVPAVYKWSYGPVESSETPEDEVGAGYIIMEKCRGVKLSTFWSKMNIEQRTRLLASLALIHTRWASVSFNQYGSLYYASDPDATCPKNPLYIEKHGQGMDSIKFAVGPSSGRRQFDNLKGAVEFYRGPWDSIQSYLEGLAQREIACVNYSPRFPKSQVSLFGPGTYIPTKDKKLRAINCYQDLIKHLLPEESISRATLWHPDFEGIFVNPDDPSEITGFVDWQAAETKPLYDQAEVPDMSAYEGPSVPGAEAPNVPEFVQKHGEDAQAKGQEAFTGMIRDMLNMSYKAGVKGLSELLMKAQEFRSSQGAGLLMLGSSLFIDGEPMYMKAVLKLQEDWAECATSGAAYPFDFPARDQANINADHENWARAGAAMQRVTAVLSGFGLTAGFMVPSRQLHPARGAVRQLKQAWVRQMELDGFLKTDEQRKELDALWPFDD